MYPGYLNYNEAFLRHWYEFADALADHQHTLRCLPKGTVSSLTIGDIELPPSLLVMLFNALRSTHFKKIRLRNNDFGRDGIKFALEYMQNNPVLEEFRLQENPIDHEDDINQLCEIIKHHPAINDINITNCHGEGIDGYNMICSIMTAGARNLKAIHLPYNYISTGGNTFIADFLATNPILEQLELWGNQLGDEDAKSVADALKHNKNLRYLRIDHNSVTNSGLDAMRKAEFDSTSLNSAADSNHTCNIYPVSIFNGGHDYKNWLDPKRVRQKKICHVLSFRNRECSNVKHFDDVPIEFLPDMLTSIQQYSEYHLGESAPARDGEHVNSLSVVYEVMRFWDKVISVYESLSN